MVSNKLSEFDTIEKLRSSKKSSDKEILQVIEHYRKVIHSQRLQIAILTKSLRRNKQL